MKRQLRGFFTGAALLFLILLSVGTVYAAAAGVSISVVYNNIKVLLNGNELSLTDITGKTVEPFIYDGTTYLPIRAIAEALNKTIAWDAEARHVLITDGEPISPVPDKMGELLKPNILALLGKSRAEIREQYRMETSERDTAFWYSGLGALPDGTEGNVFLSYSIDGMSYSGLCDYISGEIERISLFERGTTFAQFEQALGIGPVAGAGGDGEVAYQIGDYAVFARPLADNAGVIDRLTIKDQPASAGNAE